MNPDQNHRILIIDDNRSIHADFRKVLTKPKAASDHMAAAEAELFGEEASAASLPELEID